MQMRLGFIGENNLQGVEADCLFATQHGYDGLEYNYWGEFAELTADTVARMRALHQAHGVRAASLGIWGWNYLSLDPEERKQAHEMLDRAIGFAQALHADAIIMGGGDMPGEPLARKVEEFARVFPPFLVRIRDAGLKPAFYAVHGNSFLDTLKAYELVWEQFPEVAIKYDPANWRHHGNDYLEVVERHGDKVGYVHIKEHLYRGDVLASQPAAGMGDIEWGKVMAFLYEHNYAGWLSVEPHGPIWSRGEMREKMLKLTRRHIGQFLV
jgi:sugar phosphate isomerase/epimerase